MRILINHESRVAFVAVNAQTNAIVAVRTVIAKGA